MPKPDGTLDNTNENATENENSSTEAIQGENQSKTDGDNKPTSKTYSEAEYKGLQAVIAKRDQTIAQLTNEKQDAINQLAEERANHGAAETEKTSLSQRLTSTAEEKTNLENQVASLQKKIEHQSIIMKDFPDLSLFMSFLPEAADEETFRAKAKELQSSVNKAVGANVQNALSGSSPVLSNNQEDSTQSVDEIDRLYRESAKLAGIPGKEKEYEDVYQRYLELRKDAP